MPQTETIETLVGRIIAKPWGTPLITREVQLRALPTELTVQQVERAVRRLRAKGVPIRTVVGRTGTVKHAWCGHETDPREARAWWYRLPGEGKLRCLPAFTDLGVITARHASALVYLEHGQVAEFLAPFDVRQDTFSAGDGVYDPRSNIG